MNFVRNIERLLNYDHAVTKRINYILPFLCHPTTTFRMFPEVGREYVCSPKREGIKIRCLIIYGDVPLLVFEKYLSNFNEYLNKGFQCLEPANLSFRLIYFTCS